MTMIPHEDDAGYSSHGSLGPSVYAMVRVLDEIRSVADRIGLRPGKNGKPREIALAERWESDLFLATGRDPHLVRHMSRSMWDWGVFNGYRILTPRLQ